jgi:hypothetical protein
MPPTTTIAKTIAATASSRFDKARGLPRTSARVVAEDVIAESIEASGYSRAAKRRASLEMASDDIL